MKYIAENGSIAIYGHTKQQLIEATKHLPGDWRIAECVSVPEKIAEALAGVYNFVCSDRAGNLARWLILIVLCLTFFLS
jgi:hypothetical protein